MQMSTPESAPLALAALALIALVLIGWRAVLRHRPGDGPEGREFDLLPPPDHDRPARLMLADLAGSGAFEPLPRPRLLGGERGAAFGRSIRISARRIAYRDFAGGAWADAHAARLEHIYPGIRVMPRKEGNC